MVRRLVAQRSNSCSLLRLQTRSSGDRKSVQTLRVLQTLLWKKPCPFSRFVTMSLEFVWKFDTTKFYGYLKPHYFFLQYAIAGHPQIIMLLVFNIPCCILINITTNIGCPSYHYSMMFWYMGYEWDMNRIWVFIPCHITSPLQTSYITSCQYCWYIISKEYPI